MSQKSVRYVAAAAASLYFSWCAYDPMNWRLLDNVNLVIHEAGHVVFMPFGQTLSIAGGSLFQVIVPAVFAGYFYYNDQRFSGSLVLFWVGHSLLNVSVYAGDSLVLQLPLLGGEDTLHDWNYLLSEFGLLPRTYVIAAALRVAATLVILAAAALSFIYAGATDADEC